MSDLFEGPRYYRNMTFHKHTDRTVGFLELFYDLVYVATLIQIGNFLSSNLNWTGFGQFLVLMFVTWWAWSGETTYQNRYVVDDVTHRILVMVQMFGVAAMGLSVSDAFGSLSTQFALSFVLVRSLLAVMWFRSARVHPAAKAHAVTYISGFAGGIAIWLGSIALPEDARWVAWLVAIVFEIVFFSRPAALDEIRQWPPDDHHLVERMGIFTIIVLGEAFVKVLDDAQGTALGVDEIVSGALLITALFALWWLHFSDSAGELYDLDANAKPLAWMYGHLVLAIGLVMFGVAAKKLFGETLSYPDESVTDTYRILLTGSLVIFLVAQAAITFGVDDALTTLSQKRRVVGYIATAAIIAVLGVVVTSLTAAATTGLLTAVLLIPVIDAIAQTKRLAATASTQPEQQE
ncbi:MAG: low temperature requirement protein A [Actinomycetota bacterium]